MKQSVQKTKQENTSVFSLSNPKNILIAGLVVVVIFLFWYRGGDEKDATTKAPIVEESCPVERSPVCGTDGKTYSNVCTAQRIYKATIAYDGECRADSATTITPTPDVPKNDSGAEVDSGIEKLAQVPATLEDRPVEESQDRDDDMLAGQSTQSGSALLEYSNTALRYAFSMPKNSYYSAFGAQDGASHTVGIATGTGVESFPDAPVRVYFYANKILDELRSVPNGFYTDKKTGTVYLLLEDRSSVRIESDEGESEIVRTIIRTIRLIP